MTTAGKVNGSDPHDLVGGTMDRYEVVRLIGEGAFGVVYEVRHKKLGKRFAMKVVHRELAAVDSFVARFEQEAKACSYLSHPNCISVTDFGHDTTGQLFLVMEYVEGSTLRELLDTKGVTTRDALEIARQMLLGLEHAHAVDVIHRDIKLDNTMVVEVGDEPVVKILDFGIARVPVEQGGQLTQAGVIFGTPRYMAPEQVMSTQVDGRADLYAVGVVLWMLLTGEAPVDDAGDVELLKKKLSAPDPRLGEAHPGRFSSELCAVIDKALAKAPSERFGSAQEMRRALETVLAAPHAIDSSQGRAVSGETALGPTAFADAVVPAGIHHRMLSRTTESVRWARAAILRWFSCDGFPGTPSWRGRARGLVSTSGGRLVLGGLLSLLLFGVLAFRGEEPTAALVTLPARTPGAAAVQARRAKPEGLDPGVERRLMKARLFLARKACREAALDLRNLVLEKPELAGGFYLLGAAEVCRRRYPEALQAYGQAIGFDGRYRKDARIAEDLRTMLRSRRHREAAFSFIEKVLGKEGGVALLTPIASGERKRRLRHRARRMLSRWGATGDIDHVASLSLDLAQLSTCKKRLAVLRRLIALDDPKALPALKRARRAKGGFLGLQAVNGCLQKELKAAIAEFERQAK